MPGTTLPGSAVALLQSMRTVIGTSVPPIATGASVPDVGVTTLSHGVIEPVRFFTVQAIGVFPSWAKRYVVRSVVPAPAGRPVRRLSLVTPRPGVGATGGLLITRGVLKAVSISSWSDC